MIFVPSISTPVNERRGIVLLVVMALLTLFAAVGLTFVFYAEAESTVASFGTDAVRKNVPDVDAQLLFSFYLGHLLYDVDDTNGVYSSLRGHSLGRNAWGYNYTVSGGTYYINPNGIPFTGIGRAGSDNVVNYIYYPTDPTLKGQIYDPERGGQLRASNTAAQTNSYIAGQPGYTFPDRNNVILGAMNGSGEILIQSCYRPWMETAGNKYTYLRPDDTWNKSASGNFYPLPDADGGGHVKNVENSPGTVYYNNGVKMYYMNDSWWMDLGFPVQIAPNGQKFKPLFAAFVTDMDNKINANAAGNIRVNSNTHASSNGLGPWEINPSKVLTQADWSNLFTGNTGTYPGLNGRYYPSAGSWYPANPGTSGTSFPNPPPYSWYDLNGANTTNTSVSNKYVAPGENPVLAATNAKPIQITATNHGFSTGNTIYVSGAQGNTAANGTWVITVVDANNFTLTGSDGTASGAYTGGGMASPYPNYMWFPYYNPASFGNSSAAEVLNHPALFNVFDPNYNSPANSLRLFPWSDFEALMRYGGTGSPALGSDLFRLCPTSFTVAGSKAARLLTPHSFDFGRPSATPWMYPNAGNAYQLLPGNQYPTLATATGISTPAFAAGSPNNGEFGPDWRGLFGAQGLKRAKGTPTVGSLVRRLNLNRSLTNYSANGGNDKQAILDRQQLAKDIFDHLRLATTGNWPGTAFPAVGTTQYNALQWLAQLSVNIVDYIDTDNNITPWQWDTANGAWVYGTENIRTVINEVYSEIANDPTDPSVGTIKPASKPYQVNFWVELLNPLIDDGAGTYNQTLQDKNGADYEIVIGTVPAAGGISSDPTATPPNMLLDITNYTYLDAKGNPVYPPTVNPAGTSYSGGPANGFCVVGPLTVLPGGKVTSSVLIRESAASVTIVLGGLGYKVGDTITLAGGTFTTATVLTVSTVGAGGVVTGVTLTTPGSYTALPTNPVAQGATSGTGAGATFKVVWNSMRYPLPVARVLAAQFIRPHNVYLRRLACPALPFNSDKTNALYNPYVTVDFVSHTWLNDAVQNDSVGKHAPLMPTDQRYSVGRRQPYANQFQGNIATGQSTDVTWPTSQWVGEGRPLSGASNAKPIKITLNNHGFNTGDKVVINGVQGNTAANSAPLTPWVVAKVDANNFTLNGSDGTASGVYIVGTGLGYNGAYYDYTQPQNSFFQHNGLEPANPNPATAGQVLKLPFDWLVHMDRPLLSPVEIMQVSAYSPHRLTHKFMTNTGRFQHLAPWTKDPTALLYRVFEFLEIGSQAAGVTKGKGRIPGMINFNTVWDREILQALADPQVLSRFTAADVNVVFNALLQSRNPNLTNVGNAKFSGNTFAGDLLTDQALGGVNSFNDRPFRSFSTGIVPKGDSVYYPNSSLATVLGINDTLFRNNTFQSSLSLNLTDNPYTKNEMLSKVFNNVTTRSNVFAVWLTVGFFAVTDDTVTPPRLGQEIGRSEGRNIRHRMFALVDRSAMLVPSTLTTLTAAVSAGNGQTATVNNLNGTATLSGNAVIGSTNWGSHNTTMNWMIQPGCTLIVDQGLASEEVVVVTATGANSFTANFVNAHANGAVVSVYGSIGPTINGAATVHGYPGPQSRFDPRYNTAVVPYFSIIE